MSLHDHEATENRTSPASRTINIPRRQQPSRDSPATDGASPISANQPKLSRSVSTGIDLGRGSASLGTIQVGTAAQDFSTPTRISNDESQIPPTTGGSPLSKFRIDSSYATNVQKPLSDELLFTPIPKSSRSPRMNDPGDVLTTPSEALIKDTSSDQSPVRSPEKTAHSSVHSTPSQPVSDLAVQSPNHSLDDISSNEETHILDEDLEAVDSKGSSELDEADMDDTFRMYEHHTEADGEDIDDISQLSTTSAFSSVSQSAEHTTPSRLSTHPSSDETFSPIISRSTSYAPLEIESSESPGQAQQPFETQDFLQDHPISWDINPLARLERQRPFSEGSPIAIRAPSPKRAASVEVLAASTCGEGDLSEQSGDEDLRTESTETAFYPDRLPKSVTAGKKSVIEQTASDLPLESTERPNTAETNVSSGSHRHERDTVPDISYEQSFMPPQMEIDNHKLTGDILDAVSESEEKDYASSNLAHESPKANDGSHARSAQVSAEEKRIASDGRAHLSQSASTLTPKQFNKLYFTATPESGTMSTSPQLRDGQPSKAWETPAANKQYINEIPTRTAISRRVENFQIPPDRLAALQPEIAAMHTRNRRPSDKLSLKESSAQIDALLNENWGLKMKIMFMDQHFEHDREKAELIAENVRLQTNGYNFVQQVKARDKTIRALQKEVSDLEFSKASGRDSSIGSQELKNAEDKIVELEDYIEHIEDDHATLVASLQASLASSSHDLQQTEERLDQLQGQIDGTTAADLEQILAQNEELRESLADAEEELEQREHEYEDNLSGIVKELEVKHEEMLISQQKLREISSLLRQREADLDKSDQLRQLALDEVREFYEAEGLEYERYIEDRHEEIDNLKQAMNSYNQDTFDARLAEALRPHQQEWHEINQQCTEIREELSAKEAQWLQERRALEYQLESLTSREARLLDEISSLKDEALYKQEQIDELEHDRVELQSQIVALQEQYQSALVAQPSTDHLSTIDALKSEIDALQSRLTDAGAERDATLKSMKELSDKIEFEMNNNSSLTETLHDTKEKLETEKCDHNLAREKSEELENRCQAYELELEELHASLDEAKRTLAVLGDTSAKERDEASEAHTKEIKTMEEKVAVHLQDLQQSQKEIVVVREELQRISQTVNIHMSDENERHDDLCQAISDHLQNLQQANASLQEQLDAARADLEGSAYTLREYQRKSDHGETELKALQRRHDEASSAKERLEGQLRLQVATNAESEKAMKDAQKISAQARQASEHSTDSSNALLSNLLQKLYTLLPAEEQKPDMLHASDFASLGNALQMVLGLLRQNAQHAARAQKMADAEFRKQLAEREAQLASKAHQVDALKNKIDEWKSKHNELSQQQAASDHSKALRRNPAVSKQEQNSAHEQASRQVSTNSNGSAGNTEDYWTLHERIKVLNRDLKYQKELREQDDKAARQRLAESKKENKDLQSKVHQLLETSGKSRVLTLDRGGEKFARTGSRASLTRVENNTQVNDDVD